MTLSFKAITKSYAGKKALDELTLTVEPQSFTVLCGPPKSGKSTLFRILVGLEKPDSGEIRLGGHNIVDAPPADRPIGYVPQSFALYPHFTVAQNMAYPLTLARFPKAEIAERVERTAGILAITHLLRKTPDQLSGGEKQRVAVARGLLKDAELFVLDDPLVGLDYKLRERLMDELKALRAELGATFLYATSDSLEALTMAQRLAVIDEGRIIQEGEAGEVYHNPQQARSLDLIGFPNANLFKGRLSEGLIEAGPIRIAADGLGAAAGTEVIAGLRPEHVKLLAAGEPAASALSGNARVTLVENLGGEAVVYLEVDGHPLTAAIPLTGRAPPEIDETIAISAAPNDVKLFDAASGRRIRTRGPGPADAAGDAAERKVDHSETRAHG